jgi:hypothetical protein
MGSVIFSTERRSREMEKRDTKTMNRRFQDRMLRESAMNSP